MDAKVKDKVLVIMGDALGRHDIKPDMSLSSLKMDSLDQVEVLMSLDIELKTDLDYDSFKGIVTVADFIHKVERTLQQKTVISTITVDEKRTALARLGSFFKQVRAKVRA